MAYKKYIKRGGKLYGPYIYHSRRVDGKVISEYHGQVKRNYKKFIFMTLGILFLIVVVYLFSSLQKGTTGHVVFDLNADYMEGEILSGKMMISLQSGEFLPANSKVVFDNKDKKFEYNLNEVISEIPIQGEFYIKGSSLSGEGEGYGIPGERTIFPTVDFILVVESEIEEDNKTVQLNEIPGRVSAEEPFVYILGENEINAELKRATIDGKKLKLTVNEDEVIVTTDYSETEEGFGENYLGDKYKEIVIDISKLGLIFEPGNLKVSVLDAESEEELISLTTMLGEEKTPKEPEPTSSDELIEPEDETINTTINESKKIIIVPSLDLNLTTEERNILIREFGENITIKITEAVEKVGWITIKHEIGNYWIENSYVSDLSKETLDSFLERDKIKWLKDIAWSLSQKEDSEKNLEEFLGEHTF